ncbi:O-antigen ligase family protein, partial [Mariniblastus sp.]|nr:O-antigen ligase family protein [Mariniblastus sp.]
MFTFTNTASIGIAFFLLSSHIGIAIPQFFPLPSLTKHVIFAMGVIPLWWNRLNSQSTAFVSPRMRLFHLYFCFVFFIAITSAAASVQEYGMNSAFKTCGLILVFSSLICCSGYYSSKDLRNGLILYSIIELSLLYFTKSEWNANAVASRAATAAITSYFLLPYFIFGLTLFALGLTIAFRFQARTVLLSMIFAYTAVYFSRQIQKNAAAISIVLIVVFLAVASFSHEGLSALRKYAKSSLSSQSEVAQFFLSDKNESDIEGDFFDRQLAWSSGFKKMQKHPFLGIGLGNEEKTGGLASHNAYLSLAIEGGLLSLVLWML